MTKYSKMLKLPIPDNKFSSFTIGIEDAKTFEECDAYLIAELKEMGFYMNDGLKKLLKMEEK